MRTTDIFPLGVVALVAAVILTIIASMRQKRTFRQATLLFVVRFGGIWYALAAVTLLFKLATIRFAFGVHAEMISPLIRSNFVPFATITNYINHRNDIQIIGNFGVMLPLPILLLLNFPKMNLRRVAIISAIATAMIEPLQLLVNVIIRVPYNSIDIDDLILNAVGAAAGICVAAAIIAVRRKRRAGVETRNSL